MIALFIQNFRNGFDVVARKRKYLLNRIKQVIFQLIIKIPIAMPTNAAAKKSIFPKYSGARKRESTPYFVMNLFPTDKKRINQNTNKI